MFVSNCGLKWSYSLRVGWRKAGNTDPLVQNSCKLWRFVAMAMIIVAWAIYPESPIVTGTFRQGLSGVLVACGLASGILAMAFASRPCPKIPSIRGFADGIDEIWRVLTKGDMEIRERHWRAHKAQYIWNLMVWAGAWNDVKDIAWGRLLFLAERVKELQGCGDDEVSVGAVRKSLKETYNIFRAFDLVPAVGYDPFFRGDQPPKN
ncbi:MAG TPA: hypothetical protein VI953_02530 [Candidatus Paceibacterota bacterium]